ncbi:hypothetical protein TNCV_3840901 [Trichonephila clavipes]|nr:hypothetical protein TNCV_3840901 [Trichonephila clavipes]
MCRRGGGRRGEWKLLLTFQGSLAPAAAATVAFIFAFTLPGFRDFFLAGTSTQNWNNRLHKNPFSDWRTNGAPHSRSISLGSRDCEIAQVGPGVRRWGEVVPKILTYLGFSGIPGSLSPLRMVCVAQITVTREKIGKGGWD